MKSGGAKNSGQILAETVRAGHVRIPIAVERSGQYVTFRATWYEGGKRTRRGFADRGDLVDVRARNAKTRQRRLIPILPALKAWLGPTGRSRGPSAPFTIP